MIGDKDSAQCDNCRTVYQSIWQEKRDLLDALIQTTNFICEKCKYDWGGKCNGVCEDMEKWNKVIEMGKSGFKGLY
jgi:hypothetical protein